MYAADAISLLLVEIEKRRMEATSVRARMSPATHRQRGANPPPSHSALIGDHYGWPHARPVRRLNASKEREVLARTGEVSRRFPQQ